VEKPDKVAVRSLAAEVLDDTAETHLVILGHRAAELLAVLETIMAEPALLVYV
jgi:hypothetical protein